MKLNDEKKLVTLIIILSIVAILILMLGCTTPPDKKDYVGRPDSCFDFAACMYLNMKNTDKSICADYAKECRAYSRFNFCKDEKNLPDRVDFEKCNLYLNQK